jgi:hypothetical protein
MWNIQMLWLILMKRERFAGHLYELTFAIIASYTFLACEQHSLAQLEIPVGMVAMVTLWRWLCGPNWTYPVIIVVITRTVTLIALLACMVMGGYALASSHNPLWVLYIAAIPFISVALYCYTLQWSKVEIPPGPSGALDRFGAWVKERYDE